MPELPDVTVTFTAKEAAESHLAYDLLLRADDQVDRTYLKDHRPYIERSKLALEAAMKKAGYHLTDDGWIA